MTPNLDLRQYFKSKEDIAAFLTILKSHSDLNGEVVLHGNGKVLGVFKFSEDFKIPELRNINDDWDQSQDLSQ